jgi:hypothetical protein
VIDNVVWTNSWLSISGAARLVLVQVKNKHVRSLPVRPPGVEKTSRLGLRDTVADEVKCGPHGGKNSGMKSWTVSWLSLKTKVESGQRGSRVMSGDWRRLHRVHGVCSGSPENHSVEPQNRGRRLDEEVLPPRSVQPPRRGGQTAWAGLTANGGAV